MSKTTGKDIADGFLKDARATIESMKDTLDTVSRLLDEYERPLEDIAEKERENVLDDILSEMGDTEYQADHIRTLVENMQKD